MDVIHFTERATDPLDSLNATPPAFSLSRTAAVTCMSVACTEVRHLNQSVQFSTAINEQVSSGVDSHRDVATDEIPGGESESRL
jgi:hypothetical protein